LALEIEKKYLVEPDPKKLQGLISDRLEQFYLSTNPCVRVRIRNGRTAMLCIKLPTDGPPQHGYHWAQEYEYEIPVQDARAMANGNSIIKRRYYKPVSGGFMWEIDVFEGGLSGLCLAEVEVQEKDVGVSVPFPDTFKVTRDVSEDPRYSNAALSITRKVP